MKGVELGKIVRGLTEIIEWHASSGALIKLLYGKDLN
jgi:hypothetical protein